MNNQDPSEQNSSDTLSQDAEALKKLLCSHLDNRVDKLDYNVTSRLSALRHRALAGAPQPARTMSISRYMLTGGLCAAAMVAFLVTRMDVELGNTQEFEIAVGDPQDRPVSSVEQTNIMNNLNLLSAKDDIDFYQSVEFLEWMEMNSG